MTQVLNRMYIRYQRDPRYFSDDARWAFFVITGILTVLAWSIPALRQARVGSVLSAGVWSLYLPIRALIRVQRGSPPALIWADVFVMGANFYWWHWLPVAVPLLSVIVCWEAIWALSLRGALMASVTLSLCYIAIILYTHPSLPAVISTAIVAPFYPLLTLLSYYLRRQLTHVTTLATHDALTGLWNRRALPDQWDPVSAKSWMVLLDLDDFKAINDRHGHVVGDRVLQAVATVIKDHVTPPAMALRYGGEEFCLLLPPQSVPDIAVLLTHLLKGIADLTPVPFVHVTLSGGLAQVQPDEVFTSVIMRADRALYQAKAAGKNQCHWIAEDSQQTWVITEPLPDIAKSE